jgi:hypothetical protein
MQLRQLAGAHAVQRREAAVRGDLAKGLDQVEAVHVRAVIVSISRTR